MKVAYFCHRIPYPPDKGDKIRAFHQIRGISARHEVDLFTLVDDPADLRHQESLAAYCRRITLARVHPRSARIKALPSLLTRTPLTVPYFHSAELYREVVEAFRNRSYDRVFVYCSAMSQYVVDPSIPVITDLVDVDSDKWKQYATRARFPLSAVYIREHRCLRNLERGVCQASAGVIVTTDHEARLVREICDSANVHVITNGVDTGYFHPPAERPDASKPCVIFTGDMSYFPNEDAVVWFARNVFPLLRREMRDTRFLIVGRNPRRNVRELQAISGVEVTGFVPDVRPYLASAHVSVAPFSITAGIPNKILEAMACGLPIVGKPRAARGLSPNVAAMVETAETAGEFCAAVVHLLRNPDIAARKGEEGRRRVGIDYNWDRSIDQTIRLIEDPAAARTFEPVLH